MTPTEQQMQEFKDWYGMQPNTEQHIHFTEVDWDEMYQTHTAYHQHCLMKPVENDLIDFLVAHTKWMALGEEGMPPNPRFERVKFCKQIIDELRKLAALQEKSKDDELDIRIHKDVIKGNEVGIKMLQQQLTASQERCKELESKIEQGHKTYNNHTKP